LFRCEDLPTPPFGHPSEEGNNNEMTATTDIVQKLWNLCNALRDDGISYLQYTTELTYLLFLKMTQEREMEGKLPEGYRWRDLTSKDGVEQLNFYRELLLNLGSQEAKPLVQAIYANATPFPPEDYRIRL
jgi:type I restriction enzyme M protein